MKINLTDIDCPIMFLTPPAAQGQIVEVSYAGLYDGRVLRRTRDRSDDSISYDIARLHPSEQDDDTPLGLNREPKIQGGWRPCEIC